MSKEGFNQEAWDKLVEQARKSEGLVDQESNTDSPDFSDLEKELNEDQAA